MKRIFAFIMAVSILLTLASGLTGCSSATDKVGTGACEYFGKRDVEGRDIKYVKIAFEDFGSVIVLLDATTAPITVANFLKLVNSKFYDGLTIHRVISNFMIQGGDPYGTGQGGSSETITGEFAHNGYWNDISHYRGVISMARSNSYNSASSQFFICNADSQRSLDYRYAAFGYVIAGMSVIDDITSYSLPYISDKTSGKIDEKYYQPVIDSIVEISEEEALGYTK